MTLTEKSKVGDWVAENINYAGVLDSYGIDFCCGGGKSLEEACEARGVNPISVKNDLLSIPPMEQKVNANAMTLSELTDYLQREFHDEIRIQIPLIHSYIEKVCLAHGSNHTELFVVKELLEEGFEDLLNHLEKEEQVLFPLVQRLEQGQVDEFIMKPILVMESEHDQEGERYKRIAELTNQYTAPEDGCNSYKYLYELLRKFEQRLHLHIHTENNILFPKIKNHFTV